jgi:signal transduction histidine kinase
MTSKTDDIEARVPAPAPQRMRWLAGRRLPAQTIRGEFVLFATCLALPLVALIGYGLYDRARDEFAAVEVRARRIAESNADRAGEYVHGLRVTLEAVARRPLVRAMDAERCDPRLADLVDLYPRAGSLIVVDNGGAILCSSRPLPRDRVLRIVDQELLREMLAAPRFRVSKPVVSRVSGRWIVSAVQPVYGDGGALAGTVAMATDLGQWRPFPPPEGLPAGAVVTVVTADATIIARSADAEQWIGRKVWDERIIQRLAGPGEGVLHASGPDGVARIFGIKAVSGLPWFVLAGLPEETVFAQARERLLLTAAMMVLVLAMVLALSWYFVRRFSRPIRAIAAAVRARAEMHADAKLPPGGPREIAEVAAAFNRLVESEGRSAREREHAQERLARLNRELEDRVRERTAALEALNKELESFSYSVSHDLRAPLRAVGGYARMLEEDHAGALNAEGRRLLQVVRSSSWQMGQLIDDLLEFSRLGRQEPLRSRIDVADLVREVIGELARDTRAAVEVSELPHAEADRALLKQVWTNLIGNALKYSGKRDAARVEIGGREEQAENVYWVRDNGVGFDMRYTAKLFGVFQRLHRADEFPGTGVGLAIVQRVVARHGGRVWAEGKPGEGACFYFSLPREAA